jgi:hypothetical protein
MEKGERNDRIRAGMADFIATILAKKRVIEIVDLWNVLHREIGERIWPEWFPEDHFAPFKLKARTWNALYQQRPAPEEGDYFKSEWLKTFDQDKPPARNTVRIYGASDYAVTADGGDYTVHGIGR